MVWTCFVLVLAKSRLSLDPCIIFSPVFFLFLFFYSITILYYPCVPLSACIKPMLWTLVICGKPRLNDMAILMHLCSASSVSVITSLWLSEFIDNKQKTIVRETNAVFYMYLCHTNTLALWLRNGNLFDLIPTIWYETRFWQPQSIFKLNAVNKKKKIVIFGLNIYKRLLYIRKTWKKP